MFRPDEQDRSIVSAIVPEYDDLLDEQIYTTGRWTGETGPHGESYELVIENPLVETDRAFYHYEDMYELTKENIDRFIG